MPAIDENEFGKDIPLAIVACKKDLREMHGHDAINENIGLRLKR